MILHSQQGVRGKVIDLDTGQSVRKVIWLDQEKGELEAYKVDQLGKEQKDINGDYITYRAKGRFKFVSTFTDSCNNRTSTNQLGAPTCAKCFNPLTLLGSDLCAFCNAADKGYKASERFQSFRVKKISDPLARYPCQHKGCSSWAEYQVSDEVPATPAVTKPVTVKGFKTSLWDRAAVVGRRFYCSFHFQPPRILDAKGEIVKELEEAGGVRPL